MRSGGGGRRGKGPRATVKRKEKREAAQLDWLASLLFAIVYIVQFVVMMM